MPLREPGRAWGVASGPGPSPSASRRSRGRHRRTLGPGRASPGAGACPTSGSPPARRIRSSRRPIRRLPAPTSRASARVRYLTEDGFPEVYPATPAKHGRDGARHERVRRADVDSHRRAGRRARRACAPQSHLVGDMPSAYACYRFTAKLRTYGALLAACIERVTTSLRDQLPSLAVSPIDGSDMTACVNGPRYVSKGGRERERLSDPDASWGHRSAVSTRKGGSTTTRSTRRSGPPPIFRSRETRDRPRLRVHPRAVADRRGPLAWVRGPRTRWTRAMT